jgi:hypothetical protein
VFGFFASDNILGYLSGWLFYPTIILGSVICVLWQLELLPVLVDEYLPTAKSAIS